MLILLTLFSFTWAQIEYVTGYVLRKLKIKIFKDCQICLSNWYNDDDELSSITIREYNKIRKCLSYPSQNLIKCFSNIQDIIINIIWKMQKKKIT